MNRRVIGALLFIIGIVVALISAAKLPAIGTVSDMLPLYMSAVALSLVGLLLLHYPCLEKKKRSQVAHHTFSMVIKLLEELLVEMQRFGEDIDSLDGVNMARRVNFLLDKYILPFVAARQEVVLMLGQYQGVEVLVAVAQGERLLNRMYSAASDDHVIEAMATYPKALMAIENAYRIINGE
ncbi:MAG: hypothetical protein KAI83_02655 [Thiomargarita sp.]|nr:hypothetical protein [Thiomargarita sp.]